jgi:NAD(P)-dependent dehydrogenase (short-subunit alcohol dehydrogenase family)
MRNPAPSPAPGPARTVALVTGGARGIGLGISQALAREGFSIAICGRKDESEVAAILDQIRSEGTEVQYVKADVANRKDHANLLSAIRDRFGVLHILVNNAGIAPTTRSDILEVGEESYDRVMDVNLKGPFFLTQAAANWMIEQRQNDPDFDGTIVNMSSISATLASTNRGEYTISKAGISMATQLWAVRLAGFGINVFEVRPGIIKTDMTSGVTEKYDKLIAEGLTLQKRWGRIEDVGRAVAALCRGDLSYSTGQVIMVDGGLTVGRL